MPHQLRFERRLRWLAVGIVLPGSAVALGLLWLGAYDSRIRWSLTIFILVTNALGVAALLHRVVFPLQTLANLLGGLREGDFATRARGAVRDDALGEVLIEANALAETLRGQRMGAVDASALLRTVMAELEVAVFAFDDTSRLQLVNRAGETLLRRPAEQLLGRTADELRLGEGLAGEPNRTLTMTFPGGVGRYGLRRTAFRQGGKPHGLLVLTDLSRALREEERQAWQRLLRVLGHELNNSLAPIKSIAASLEQLLQREPLPDDWREDTRSGLGIISARTDSLARFLDGYARLSRLPPPRTVRLDLAALIHRVAELEQRVPVTVEPGPPVEISADLDQLEQLLINLVRNAAEAGLEMTGAGSPPTDPTPGTERIIPSLNPSAPAVCLSWQRADGEIRITVADFGPGLANPANLFVPFFTTKARGSGIGLTLCRQIAEAHGGTLTLENQVPGPGCLASLRLPISIEPRNGQF